MSQAPLAGITALYGGSFNPPHMGHQTACLYLLEALGAEAVWLVPTAKHAFAKVLAPFAHRRCMAERLAAPFGDRVHVSAVEAELGGTSTTHATLLALQQRHPERRWAVVVGSDLVPDLPRWDQAADLFARAQLVVLGRAGAPPSWQQASFPARPWRVEPSLALPEVSSEEVRARLRRGEDVTGWVPAGVRDYVAAQGLYRA